MLTILHGDNEVQIHLALAKHLQAAKASATPITRLEAKRLELADLELVLGNDALFASHKLVIISDLFSLPKSKRKDSLISTLKSFPSSIDLILLDHKVLTASQLKSFSTATISLFKHPQLLFKFLESIGVLPAKTLLPLFHELLKQEAPELVSVMLARQVRLLIAFVADGTFDGPPFLRAKLGSQSKHFTLQRLLAFHTRLLSLDRESKTSTGPLTLTQQLDLLLVEV